MHHLISAQVDASLDCLDSIHVLLHTSSVKSLAFACTQMVTMTSGPLSDEPSIKVELDGGASVAIVDLVGKGGTSILKLALDADNGGVTSLQTEHVGRIAAAGRFKEFLASALGEVDPGGELGLHVRASNGVLVLGRVDPRRTGDSLAMWLIWSSSGNGCHVAPAPPGFAADPSVER